MRVLTWSSRIDVLPVPFFPDNLSSLETVSTNKLYYTNQKWKWASQIIEIEINFFVVMLCCPKREIFAIQIDFVYRRYPHSSFVKSLIKLRRTSMPMIWHRDRDSRYVAVTATNSQGSRPRDSSLRCAIASRIRKHVGVVHQRKPRLCAWCFAMEIGHSVPTTRRIFRNLSWLHNPFSDSPNSPSWEC